MRIFHASRLSDTGASVSVLDASALYRLGLTKDDFVSPVSLGVARVNMADGQSMPLLGAVDCLFLTLGSCTHRRVQMLVAERLCGVDALLGLDLLMSIGATISLGSEPPMLSSPSGSVPIVVMSARPRCTPQPEAATDSVQDACVCDEDEAVHNPAVKSGSDHSFCPYLDASQTDCIADDDLSFEEACPPTPVSCPRCDEGGCTGFVVQASSPTIVPAQSEVVFPGLVRLKNEIAYPKDIGFFSPS